MREVLEYLMRALLIGEQAIPRRGFTMFLQSACGCACADGVYFRPECGGASVDAITRGDYVF